MVGAHPGWAAIARLPRRRPVLALVSVLAASVVGAGWSAQPPAGPSARRGWDALPLSARAVVARTLGFADQEFWARGSADRFAMKSAGLGATFSDRGVVVHGGGVSWPLGVEGYGRGTRIEALGRATPTASRNRVAYRLHKLGLLEWYANGPIGIEQGFALSRPPSGPRTHELTLSLGRLPSGLVARVDEAQRGTVLSVRGRPVFRYASLSAADALDHPLPARVELSDGRLLLRIDDSRARYPVRIDPVVQSADPKVGASLLGVSTAVSGDGATLAVGAPGSKVDGRLGQGAVYVFASGAHGWASEHEVARLTASDGAIFDALGSGYSYRGGRGIAISGDGTTIVAAAPGSNGSLGAAYVFQEPVEGWTSEHEAAKLTASAGSAGYDQLGPVAISADGATVAVGSYGTGDDYGYGGGAGVYVFTRPSGGWTSEHEAATLTSSDGDGGIGNSVPAPAISDDGATIVVGAGTAIINDQVEEHTSIGQGAAYIFSRPAAGWSGDQQEDVRLIDPHGQVGDAFGASVAITGDGTRIALTGGGAVQVFSRRSARWARTAELALLKNEDAAVDISDPGTTIAVGGADVDGKHGVVEVFRQPGSGGWHDAGELTPARRTPADNLGDAVAMSDGGTTIIAGADGASRGQGKAYAFQRPAHGWSTEHQAATLTASHNLSTADFGASVATSADGSTIVVGAPYARVPTHGYVGGAFVLTEPAAGWTAGASIGVMTAPDGHAGDAFGASVAISGDGATVAVSAPGARIGAHSLQGAVYVFKRLQGGWANEHRAAKLTASDGAAHDGLGAGGIQGLVDAGGGISISWNGSTIVAGAPSAKNLHGAVYVFSKPSRGWTSEHQIAELTKLKGGSFVGYPVAISAGGGTIAAAAGGKVLVFSKPRAGWAHVRHKVVLFVSRTHTVTSLAVSFKGWTIAAGRPGSITVFTRSPAGWTDARREATLTASSASGNSLGSSMTMSVDGSTIAAAAYIPLGPNRSQAAVFVFTKPGTGWSNEHETAKLTTSDAAPFDGLGNALATSANGDTIVATAPEAGDYSQGAAYTFTRPATGWSDEQETARLRG